MRRLIALGLLGAAHQLLHPGEALEPYAIIGLVILLPATWLPTWLVLTGGLLGTVASVTLAAGGILSIPGLFLLGLAVARLGIAHTLDRRTGQLAAVLALSAPAAAAAVWWQHTYSPVGPFATRIAAEAGLLGALAYATALLLLLRTPLGRPLSAVLEPLGRMALTNYLTATLAVTAASRCSASGTPRAGAPPCCWPRGSSRCRPSSVTGGCAGSATGPSSGACAASPGGASCPSPDPWRQPPETGQTRTTGSRVRRREAAGSGRLSGHSQDRLPACDFGAQCRKAATWAMILPMRYRRPGPGPDAGACAHQAMARPSSVSCGTWPDRVPDPPRRPCSEQARRGAGR